MINKLMALVYTAPLIMGKKVLEKGLASFCLAISAIHFAIEI
ncbi:hypothetical protein [Photorhabdus bodei]|nr:hypothetical protein [Photorhabdus bodei]